MPPESWNKASREEVERAKGAQFERTILPYLNPAYNLARWLTRNEHDAEDLVQESFLRAFRSFDSLIPGRDARAWFLTIVRNCCRTFLRQNRLYDASVELDENSQSAFATSSDPEALLIRSADSQRIRQALEELPIDYREILVLREFEELSYKEIAQIVEIPIGTVMSRLSRARKDLHARLNLTADEKRK